MGRIVDLTSNVTVEVDVLVAIITIALGNVVLLKPQAVIKVIKIQITTTAVLCLVTTTWSWLNISPPQLKLNWLSEC